MAKTNKLSQRFAELAEQLEILAATKKYQGEDFEGDYIDNHMFTGWKIKTRHLIAMVCGEKSTHYEEFVERENGGFYSTNYTDMLHLKAVFEATREDFEGGYLNSVRSLVQAEVFSNELEQAHELFKSGYHVPAAVVAGVVLETTLRQLCEDADIAAGSLNKMNADLSKAGVYNLLVQKRITALADIRNNAAHGNPENFTIDDVRDMIAKVEAFVAEHV